ncbi:MAG: acyl carrier protein [Eubacteriales bacterium]|nr:acyl carrier protein [Eubacteriales bacterium]
MEFAKMKEIIADVLNVDPEEITMETTFTEDLGADSLDLFQIIMEIENKFGVKVPVEKAESVKTVGEAVALIQEAGNGQ